MRTLHVTAIGPCGSVVGRESFIVIPHSHDLFRDKLEELCVAAGLQVEIVRSDEAPSAHLHDVCPVLDTPALAALVARWARNAGPPTSDRQN